MRRDGGASSTPQLLGSAELLEYWIPRPRGG